VNKGGGGGHEEAKKAPLDFQGQPDFAHFIAACGGMITVFKAVHFGAGFSGFGFRAGRSGPWPVAAA
jgi:hypothetical protein